jgi:UDP-N-acetylglucosamine acyltransferase
VRLRVYSDDGFAEVSIDRSADVHSSAVVEPGAVVGANTKIGPFSVVGSEVVLGERVELKPHVVVTGKSAIGDETVIFPGAVIGEIPQDLKFKGEATRLVIGKRNRIREGVTMNTGTAGGGGVTKIGDDCLFMTGAHVAHDAFVGNRVIVANQGAIAGHCVIDDDVIIGGLSGIHQFVRIGKGAIIGAVTMVTNDVIPYGLVQGPRGQLDGLNLVGLKRKGVERRDITALRAAFQMLAQGEGAFQDRIRRLGEEADSAYVQDIVKFVLGASDRSFLTPER